MHRPRRRSLVLVAALAAVGASLLTACTGGGGSSASAPTTTFTIPLPTEGPSLPSITVPPGFVPADTRGVRLLAVAGKKAALPPLPVYGGTATLHGSVTGPDGPVGGATVKIERFVGDRSGAVTVQTGGDGRWSANNLLGGQYRIRAWQQPTLAADGSQVTFLAADHGSMQVDLNITAHEGRKLQAQLAVSGWNVDDSAQVRALLTDTTVNDDGIVVGEPVSGVQVKMSADDRNVSIDSDNPSTTSAAGFATWKVTCLQQGEHRITVTAGDQSASATLPSCGPRPTTTTTPDVPDFPIGTTFKVPHPGVLPAGTYTTSNAGCQTSYEVFLDGAWSSTRVTATGNTMTLDGPGRDFKAVGSSKPCEYQRVA